MKAGVKIDTTQLRQALRAWAAATHKDARDVMLEGARGIVKRVVAITPPASGHANADARKTGEGAVKVDLARLFVPIRLKGKRPEQWPDLEQLHEQARNRRGRVNQTRQRYYVDQAKLAALTKLLTGRVGILAAGWNAASLKLGVNLPAWIKRHGTGFGSIEIIVSSRGIRITIRNEVKFVDNVQGLSRRVQAAVNYQTAATERRLKFVVERAAHRAGVR